VLPAFMLEILSRLRENGFAAFAVGGCVRDRLLLREPEDWDVTTSAPPEEVMRLFPKTAPTGIRYGTVTVFWEEGKAEVTTFRSDGAYRDGRRPESVAFGKSLEEDLSRRDFTMNALALSGDGTLFDPFGGREDIENGLIRCVGDPERRFSEDALRMLRAVRFAAQLGFSIEPATYRAIEALAPRASLLSAERVRDELNKTLLSPRPETAEKLITLGLLDAFLEKRLSPGEKTLRRLKLVPGEERMTVFALLLERSASVPDAADMLIKLRLDGKTIACAARARRETGAPFPQGGADIRRLLCDAGEDGARAAAFTAFALGDETAPERLRAVLDSGDCWSLRQLAVTGDDLLALGFPKGPETGETLQKLLRLVIDQPEKNERETLMEIVKREI